MSAGSSVSGQVLSRLSKGKISNGGLETSFDDAA